MQFGEKYVFHRKVITGKLKEWLYKLKIPAIIFWGRFGTLYPFCKRKDGTPIKVGMVFGEAIPVKKQDIVDPEYMDELHKTYMEAMKNIFDNYKKDFNYGDDETLTMIAP